MNTKRNIYNNTIFSKKYKGISLVVLLITIVVIIILAAAIIITILDNNTIGDANKARFENDRDSIQSAFTSTVTKIMAKNTGSIAVNPCQLNSVTSGVKKTKGEVSYEINLPELEENKYGHIIFDRGNNKDTEYFTGTQLPIYTTGETTWYVDDEGIITLQVGDTKYGSSDGRQSESELIKSIKLSTYENDIFVEVVLNNPEDKVGKITYYISEDGKNWISVDSVNLTHQFLNAKEQALYRIKASIILADGRSGESKVYTIRTGMKDFIAGEVKITDEESNIYTEGDWTNQSLSVELISSDETTTSSYQVSGANQIGSTSDTKLLTASGISNILVTTRKFDVVKTRGYEVKIDKDLPVIDNIEFSEKALTNKNVTVTVDATDTLSQIVACQFSTVPNLTEQSNGWERFEASETITKTTEIAENGTYYVYVMDAAGNVSSKEIVIDNIDKVAPELESISVVEPQTGIYKDGQEITIVSTFSKLIKGTAPVLEIKFGNGGVRTLTNGQISGKTITYKYIITTEDNGSLTSVSYIGSITDLLGNELTVSNKSLIGSVITADTIAPTNTVPTLVATTNSIVATLRQTDSSSGVNNATAQYAIKKEADDSWGPWITDNNASHTFNNLIMNTSYQVKTKISDNAGNTVESEIATINTTNITKATISASTEWINQDVMVTITYPEIVGTTRQYSTDAVNWTNVTGFTETLAVAENYTTVYARIIDSTNQTSGNTTHTVTNIDRALPVIYSLEVDNDELTNNNVIITGKSKDELSGIVAYQFNVSPDLTDTSGGWIEVENSKIQVTHTYEVSENGTYYYYVKDAARNVTKEKIEVTNIDKIPPELNSINVTSPETGMYKVGQQITIVATYSENIVGTPPVLKIKFGSGSEKVATAGSISGRTITYTYTLSSDDNGVLTSTSYTGEVTDVVGNPLSVSNKPLGGYQFTADTVNPTVTVPTLSSNTNSITAVFGQTDALSGIDNATIQYAIKKKADSSWGTWVSDSTTHTFTNLTMNTEYEVKTKASDIAGNTVESEVATISTVNITKPTVSAPTAWTNANVTVTITYPSIAGTTKQYSTDGSNWSNTSNTTQTVSIGTNNTTVYARVIDSTNQTSGNATHKVTNIDKRLPNEFTPTGEAEVNSVKITASTSDVSDTANGSSGIKNYQFSSNNGSTWTTAQTSNVYTFTGLTNNTTYNFKVKVTDNAGNARVSNTAAIKTLLAVAKIDSTEYSSIQKAFNAAGSGKTVVLLQSTTESPTLGSDKNISFNMNNKTVTGTVTSNGSMAVSSGTITGSLGMFGNGKTGSTTNVNINGPFTIGVKETPGYPNVRISGGTIKSSNNVVVNSGILTIEGNANISNTTQHAVIYNQPRATLTIKNGTYTCPSYACVKSFGTTNIEGGTYTVTGTSDGGHSHALLNDTENGVGGTMNISGSPVIKGYDTGIYNGGTKVTVSGTPQITGDNYIAMFTVSGTTEINAGTFSSASGRALYNSGTTTVKGGTFSNSTASDVVVLNTGGSMNITNGTFRSSAATTILHNQSNATLTVSGGSYTSSSNRCVYNNDGTINLNGGTFNTTNSNTVVNYSTLNITGGNFTCNTNTGNAAVWNHKSANISGGTFNSNAFGILSNDSSTSPTTTLSGSANVTSTGSQPALYVNYGTTTLNNSAQIKYEGAGPGYGAYVAAGTLNIRGGTITNLKGTGVYSKGTLSMSAGTVTANNSYYSLYKAAGTATYTGGSIPQDKNF